MRASREARCRGLRRSVGATSRRSAPTAPGSLLKEPARSSRAAPSRPAWRPAVPARHCRAMRPSRLPKLFCPPTSPHACVGWHRLPAERDDQQLPTDFARAGQRAQRRFSRPAGGTNRAVSRGGARRAGGAAIDAAVICFGAKAQHDPVGLKAAGRAAFRPCSCAIFTTRGSS
eukprot:356861-Chlamydomonas_euryale.AAC.8